MNRTKTFLLILILILSFGCNSRKVRLELLEKELNVKLPTNYDQITNSTEGSVDFEINIELKFQKEDCRLFIEQILKTKYFNSVNNIFIDPSHEQLIKCDSTITGIWERTNRGFQFNKLKNESEPVSASFDTINGILKFNFVHL